MNIGLAIKVARIERQLTLEELANKLHLSVSYLSLLENNQRTLSVKRLVEIGETLHVKPSVILERAEGYDSPYVREDDWEF